MQSINAQKTKVICDTNVWYDLAAGNFRNVDKNIVLVPTWPVYRELISTPKIKDEFSFVKRAISEMLICLDNGVFETPLIHLNRISGVAVRRNSYQVVRNNLHEILEFSFFSEGIETVIVEKIKQFKQDKTTISKHLNVFSKSLSNKSIINKADIKASIRLFFQSLVDRFVVNPGKIKFDNIELFISVFCELIWQSRDEKFQFAKNDFFDLMNFIYVQPGDKYLSFDRMKDDEKWARLFKEANMESYIYQTRHIESK